MVTDEEILDAYRLLAATEGVFVEPASAASVAGLRKAAAEGLVERGETVVCTVTGHGSRDRRGVRSRTLRSVNTPADPRYDEWMGRALAEAAAAAEHDDVPVGAVVVHAARGEVLAARGVPSAQPAPPTPRQAGRMRAPCI